MSEIETCIEKDLEQATSTTTASCSTASVKLSKKNGKKSKSSNKSNKTIDTRSDILKSTNAIMCRGALINAIAVILNDIDVGKKIREKVDKRNNNEESLKKKSKKSKDIVFDKKVCPGKKHNLAKRMASNKKKESNIEVAKEKEVTLSEAHVGVPSSAYGDALTPLFIKSLSKSSSHSLLFI